MSRVTMMTTREKKMQAAAICQEVRAYDGNAMDLGKKLSTPKDIMLEELSLLSNKGSRLFKMRQRRSDKYTFESIQNEANAQLDNGVQGQSRENEEGKGDGSGPGAKTPANAPDPRSPPHPNNIAPGYGGPLKDVPPEKFNTTAVPKSYQSPWEQAIIHDPALAETLHAQMPVPEPQPEMPDYKSFNRVATPFGGFDKAPRGITFKLPDMDLSLPKYPELQDPRSKRPTFNRTAQGWISDGVPLIIPTVPLEPVAIPESDDL
ncbi:myozenin-2b [Paramormyrops kingsleyae]|uniref:Myozenin 2b n=1 Tax=Paramormyrops kingsleyae TaxID=1676925 RepID=A0A3B3RCB0_9TELE|nr:myozenin-2 [Paramormyrops kingsleyae]XP_023685295.1 myozenin-2 [Paramormyrops kingsleyae]